MKFNLVTYPDRILSQGSQEVEEINEDIKLLAEKMLEVMYQQNGIGLAAVQVGHLKRVIVIDVDQAQDGKGNLIKGKQYQMVNPVIVAKSSNLDEYKEGCLSFPEQGVAIKRPDKITVKYLDLESKEQTLEADGMLAKCIQHEIEHCDGISIIDHLPKTKQISMRAKLIKIKKKSKR